MIKKLEVSHRITNFIHIKFILRKKRKREFLNLSSNAEICDTMSTMAVVLAQIDIVRMPLHRDASRDNTIRKMENKHAP